MSEQKTNKVDSTQVKKGDLMALTYWVKVTDIQKNGSKLVVNSVDDDQSIQVDGKELIEAGFSADFFTEEEKIGKTKAAELLISAFNRPFTVCFEKATGEERTLRGRLIRAEPLLGRSMVEDLDLIGKDRVRQVDHRTLKFLILDGIKYVVK